MYAICAGTLLEGDTSAPELGEVITAHPGDTPERTLLAYRKSVDATGLREAQVGSYLSVCVPHRFMLARYMMVHSMPLHSIYMVKQSSWRISLKRIRMLGGNLFVCTD